MTDLIRPKSTPRIENRWLTPTKHSSLLLFCLLSVCLFSSAANAAPIQVTNADTTDVHTLELKTGQAADILVYLASLGDLVEKYLVILRRDSDNKRVRTLLSDKHGRVRFRVVPPGKYRVYVSRRVFEEGRLSTVQVGDIRIIPAKSKR